MTRVPLAEAPEALEQWLRTLAEAATPTATTVAICGAMDVILAVEKAGIPPTAAAEYNRAALRLWRSPSGWWTKSRSRVGVPPSPSCAPGWPRLIEPMWNLVRRDSASGRAALPAGRREPDGRSRRGRAWQLLFEVAHG